jgi:hypothetical protein
VSDGGFGGKCINGGVSQLLQLNCPPTSHPHLPTCYWCCAYMLLVLCVVSKWVRARVRCVRQEDGYDPKRGELSPGAAAGTSGD